MIQLFCLLEAYRSFSAITLALNEVVPFRKGIWPESSQPRNTVACRPKHPLLFAMASFNYSTARALLLLDKDPSIDINARSHEQGFTALHYAVYAAPIGLVEVILQEYQKEIDFSIAGSDLKGVSPVTVSNWAKFLLWDAQQNNNKQAVERYSVIVDLLLRYGG